MNAQQPALRIRHLVFCAVGAMVMASPAMAAKPAAVDAQYKADVALCNSGNSPEGRKTCLYEADSARVERARNALTSPSQDYQANAVQRCRALPTTEQQACVAQMSGQGKTYGSVSGGGVLREITIQVPADQAAPPSAPAPGGYQTQPASGGYQPAPAYQPAPPSGYQPAPVPGSGMRY